MKIVSLLILIVLISNHLLYASGEWSGRLKQGYQDRQQFFDLTVVQPWLSDAVTSATPTDSEAGPVTQLTVHAELDLPIGFLSLGLYGKILLYGQVVERSIIWPIIKFIDDHHRVNLGSFKTELFGTGLVVSAFPMVGLDYQHQWFNLSSQLYYFGEFERSDFQKEKLSIFGLSETWDFGPGELGLMYLYDQSDDYEDKSRGQLSKGGALSAKFDWAFSRTWKMHSEVALNHSLALAAGLDTPLIGAVSMQARVRFMDQGFNPVLGRYSREGEKQTYVNLRFPIILFAKQLQLQPQWGIKHTNDQDYWVPGIKLEFDLFDRLSFVGQLVSEQPMGKWGAKEHFEYTQVKLVYLILPDLILSGQWRKTYNGFLNWKEIQSRVDLELQW